MKHMIKLPAPGDDAAHADTAPVSVTLSQAAMRRRRLLRAGLSVAPVMLALKSQSVLAQDTCISPSAFSSMRAVDTQLTHVHDPVVNSCFSHDYWENRAHPAPYDDKSLSYFLTPLPSGVPPGSVSAGFMSNPAGAYTNITLQGILVLNGNATHTQMLARHVVATFLTAVQYPATALFTEAQCRLIWDSQGTWSPVAGATWELQDWLNYFSYIYGGP